MGRIDGLRGVADEVRQYPLDDGRLLDACDDLELPAAAPAGLDVDSGKRSDAESREHPFASLCPGQRPLPVGVRWLASLPLVANDATGPGHNPGPIRARRREYAGISSD
jgi:hypothetical protein